MVKLLKKLKIVLSNHYSSKRIVIAERYKFYNVNQDANEDVKSFVARLKSSSQHCSFGQFLSECLRDRLVCGLKSQAIKRKLLSENNLTFERAYDIALGMELAEGQVKSMNLECESVTATTESLDKLVFKKNKAKGQFKHFQKHDQNRVNSRQRHETKSCFQQKSGSVSSVENLVIPVEFVEVRR